MNANATATEHEDLGGYFENYASKECKAYVEELEEMGWKRLGEHSCYGVVFKHPDVPGYVHKVAFRPKEDGWVEFVKYALKNPNPHFPVVRGVRDYGSFFVADIERLQPVPNYSEHYVTGERIYDATSSAASGNLYAFEKLIRCLSVPLAQAVTAIKDNFLKEWKVDLHAGNFMLRGDTLVMIDPLSWRRC